MQGRHKNPDSLSSKKIPVQLAGDQRQLRGNNIFFFLFWHGEHCCMVTERDNYRISLSKRSLNGTSTVLLGW